MIDILGLSMEILRKYPLCNHCLGRLFARLSKGINNFERGYSIKLVLTMLYHSILKDEESESVNTAIDNLKVLAVNGLFEPAKDILVHLGYDLPPPNECYVCGGIFSKLDDYIKEVLKIINEYEFKTFLVGTKIPAIFLEREDSIRSQFCINVGESLKSEVNRLLGKKLQNTLNKEVSFNDPDIVIVIDIVNNSVDIQSKPIFIYGRYRKFVRDIPQTTWFCSNCFGRGCSKCNFTGKRYNTSISELIINPTLELVKGSEGIFHGAGREDVDTLTLGNGRPFIVEIKNPRYRFIDLNALEKKINELSDGKIDVKLIKFSNRREVRMLKNISSLAKKVYQAIVEVDNEINEVLLKNLEEYFYNREIRQYTPLRVLHRRADKLRIKKVYSLKTEIINKKTFKAIIECQGGLYVKELISGDNGRTLPNFSQILNSNARCIELAVIFVSEHL
ncbi:MAG: tRNA pseudouridine(54/55) synthase Pus10 [Candidatus Methanomethylicia archaeon]